MAFTLNSNKITAVAVVCSAIACFSLGIFGMSISVDYFGKMFAMATQQNAQNHLKTYYTSYMATLYLAIFGMEFVVADTIVFFTSFRQKDKFIYVHVIYFLVVLICGIVALATTGEYSSTADCTDNLKCMLAPIYQPFRTSFILFFSFFCVFFFAYTVGFHIGAIYTEPEQPLIKQETHTQKNSTKNKSLMLEETIQ